MQIKEDYFNYTLKKIYDFRRWYEVYMARFW